MGLGALFHILESHRLAPLVFSHGHVPRCLVEMCPQPSSNCGFVRKPAFLHEIICKGIVRRLCRGIVGEICVPVHLEMHEVFLLAVCCPVWLSNAHQEEVAIDDFHSTSLVSSLARPEPDNVNFPGREVSVVGSSMLEHPICLDHFGHQLVAGFSWRALPGRLCTGSKRHPSLFLAHDLSVDQFFTLAQNGGDLYYQKLTVLGYESLGVLVVLVGAIGGCFGTVLCIRILQYIKGDFKSALFGAQRSLQVEAEEDDELRDWLFEPKIDSSSQLRDGILSHSDVSPRISLF